MIRNSHKLKKFEDNLLRNSDLTIEQKLKLYDDLWNYAVKLKKFAAEKKLEVISVHLAKVLNSVR